MYFHKCLISFFTVHIIYDLSNCPFVYLSIQFFVIMFFLLSSFFAFWALSLSLSLWISKNLNIFKLWHADKWQMDTWTICLFDLVNCFYVWPSRKLLKAFELHGRWIIVHLIMICLPYPPSRTTHRPSGTTHRPSTMTTATLTTTHRPSGMTHSP